MYVLYQFQRKKYNSDQCYAFLNLKKEVYITTVNVKFSIKLCFEPNNSLYLVRLTNRYVLFFCIYVWVYIFKFLLALNKLSF